MINELLFLGHAITLLLIALGALRLGRQALLVFVVLQPIFANLFVTKQIVLAGGLTVTTADVFVVSSIFGLNLLQEYFGYASAQKAIMISTLASLLFLAMAWFQITYIPSAFDTMHTAFVAVFTHTPRIIIASIVVLFIVQQLDCILFWLFRRLLQGHLLWLRTVCSITITQAADTILFSFLGLYGIVHNLIDIIIMSFVVKLTIIALTGPLSAVSRYVAVSHDE